MKDATPKIAGKKTKKGNNKGQERTPHGRIEVKEAILDAAEKLLLKRSPSEITIREIASAANVKHPEIYRHFGTKEDVVVAAQSRGVAKIEILISQIDALEGNIGAFFQAVAKNKSRQIMLARAMIEGIDANKLKSQFPIMQRFLELLKKRQAESEAPSEHDVRILAAVFTATAFGWILYEPFLLASTGLDTEDASEVRKEVVKILEEFIKEIC